MKLAQRCGLFAASTVFTGVLLSPAQVFADSSSQQKNKNDWRNLAIGAGAVGVYGLLNHNSTATVLGAAGAAYSANRYEQDRKNQSNNQRYNMRYHRLGYKGNYNNTWNRSQVTNQYGSYPNMQYFTRNGHTYEKNMDTGDTFLVR